MKKSFFPLTLSLIVLLMLAWLMLWQPPISSKPFPAPQKSQQQPPQKADTTPASLKPTPMTESNEPLPNLDLRAEVASGSAKQLEAVAELQESLPGLSVDLDPVTGSPKWIASNARLLTPPWPATADADAPIKDFINRHRALFGHGAEALEASRRVTDYTTPRGPSRKVVWHQQHAGIDIFEAVLMANLTPQLELINLSSQFLPDPAKAAGRTEPVLSVEQAVAAAGQNVGERMAAESVRPMGPPASQPDRRQQFRAAMLTDADAKLTWLPMSGSNMRLTWDVTLTSRSRAEMYRLLVDAENGQVLVRQALTAYISNASYRVFTTDSPTPMSPGHEKPSSLQPLPTNRVLVTTPALNTTASPNGWIDDGGNITSGNNADAYSDTNADNVADLPRTTGTNRVFDFPMDTNQEPSTYKDASVTQLFYWTNFMHDRMYELGFTEAAGNFQTNNFGRGGLGNDPVNAEAQDGSGTNNANFSTPADGARGRMQMYVWTSMVPDRDSTFDTTVMFHEYGHGVSNRLVGGPSVTISALTARGMGEGWSDFYGMTLLSDAAENPHGNWPAAAYLSLLRSGWMTENYYYGLRRYSYSTDMLKNPLTFKDIDPTQIDLHPTVPRNPTYGSTQDATQVHYQGTVWCTILNELRANLMLKHGALSGNERAMFLVTEGMKYGPANPNFIQSRDGILQATLVNHPGDLGEVWTAFAKRGMGDGALAPISSTTTGIVERYRVPDSLEISDRSGWNIEGPKGGPFSPMTKTLTLSNDGAATLNWSSNPNAAWLSVSPASGSLAPGADVTVTVTTQADTLEPGFHSTNLVFTNTGSNFNQPIGIRLYVTPPVAVGFDLSTNPGWNTSGQWSYGAPSGSGGSASGGAGNADPTGGATGSRVFGVNLAGNADTSLGGPFYLTSTPVDLSTRKTTRLRFKRWLNTNVLSSTRVTVEVSTNGTTWREVFVNPGAAITDNAWQTMEYDISSIADQQPAVWVRWGYQNLVVGTAYSGWNIDDVEFLGESTAEFTIAAPSTVTESDGPITATLNLNVAQETNVTVQLSSSNPAAATVPASLTLLPGETSKTFTITPVNDQALDGTQTTVITAGGPTDIAEAAHPLQVVDDETAVLTLTAPASAAEGSLALSGSVSVSASPTQNITVQLSAASSRLLVPASLVIPAGSMGPVNFTFDAADNLLAEGPQNVTLTATMTNWTPGIATVTVIDDETPTIVLAGPTSVREGDGPQTYTATVNTVQTTGRVLNLASSDTSELIVPSSVVIPAGNFTASFNASPQNDALFDGVQNATLTASSAGFPDATRTVSIADNEVSAYTFATIASPQKRNKSFEVIITARDVNGAVITNHKGGITLTSSSPGGAIPFSPSSAAGFFNGVVTTAVTATSTATAMTLRATDSNGKTGLSNAFDVEPVEHDTFVFSGMLTTVTADTFFDATATAVNDQGSTVLNYSSPTTIDLLGSYFDRTVGSSTTSTSTDKVHNTSAHDSRCQIIYTAAELGGVPKLISNVFVSRLTTGGQSMNNYTVRLKHTTLENFDGRSWEEGAWTTVFTSTSYAANLTSHTFRQPFAYDGVQNLMVDISFNNSTASTAGTLRQTPSTSNRMLSGTSNSTHGNPTSWTAVTGPVPVISNELPTMIFHEARSFGPIPASPVAFVAGEWSGQATAPVGASMWLRATAPSGVTGMSNLISILNATSTAGTATLFSDGFESGGLSSSWSTASNSGATARTQVTSANTPNTGLYHLTLDTTSLASGTFATNRPTLTLNLAGRKNVSLEWFAKSFADESNPPTLTGPLGTFGSAMNYDGVAISQDGITWVEVSALRSLPSFYNTTVTRVFLDPVIQRLGWSFNETFRLRFSQYDDQAIPSDGIGIDDVAVRANSTNSIMVDLPPTIVEGTLNQPVTVTLPAVAATNTTVTLSSSGPARLSIDSPITIPAGQSSASTTISAPQNQFADVGKGVVISAFAPGQTTSSTHIRVVDDERPVLTLALPASVTEGGSNGTGTVFIEPVQPVATSVFFSSGNTEEATVSTGATISAGARSATFTITPVDDIRLDGSQTVSFTASGPGLVSASGSLEVLDNEPKTLTVTPPATLMEGGAPGVGTVTLSALRSVETNVTLISSDPTEATVTTSVVIPAGQTSINFQVFPAEDSVQDGTQSVALTASADGFPESNTSFQVLDNDPTSFEWAIVPSPQTRNASFAVTLTARDASDSTLTAFNGSVALSARSGSTLLPLSAALSGSFVKGVWTGNLAIGAAGSGVTLLATGEDGAAGVSEAFDVVPGGAAAALAFEPIPSPHSAGLAIPVRVSSVDAAGILVNEANGPVQVELVSLPGGTVVASANLTLVNGTASTTFFVPAGLTAVRLQGSAGSLTGQGNAFTISAPTPIAYPPPEVVFADGFEAPAFKPEWTITGTGTHRTLMTTDNGPRTGTRHLTMDSSLNFSSARNEATLTLNLTGKTDVELSFWMKESGDEDHGPPNLPFTGGADFDGVAISTDGITWYEVQGLRTTDGISSTYTQFKVNLSAAAATHGLMLGSAFKIRFNHFDDYPFTTDGFAFDDIAVTANAFVPQEPEVTIFEDNFESGLFHPQWVITGTGNHRTEITSQQVPRGSYHLLMDTHANANSRNEATLTLNVANYQDLTLKFWMKENNDEDHAPPSNTFTGGADFDGVAVSTDGTTWHEVQALRGTLSSNTYREFIVDLSAAAGFFGFTPGTAFQIRFNHFDNSPWSAGDGFAFDDIRVTGRPVQQLLLSAPATLAEGGQIMATVALPAARAVDTVITLATNRPDGVTIPASVTVPAGKSVSASFAITAAQNDFLTGHLPLQIVATAEGFRRGVVETTILDNETPEGFDLSLPSTLEEGATITGTVSMSSANLLDLPVALSASPATGLTLPPSVTLAAGSTSALFDIAKAENDTLLEPASTIVTATLGAVKDSATVGLTDNEPSAPLVISMPASVLESDAPLTCSVGFAPPIITGLDITVNLTSSDTSELTVPATVVIPAGTGGISFDVTPMDDARSDGAVAVILTASANGLTGDTHEISVRDDEVHHLVFEPIASPKTALEAFQITLRAETIDDQIVTNFTRHANLSATNAGGVVSMTPSSTTAFIQGVWTGPVTILDPTSAVRLSASAGWGLNGSSNAFDVLPGARLTASPSPLRLSLPEGETHFTVPFTLGNSGGQTATWNAEVQFTSARSQPELPSVLTALNTDIARITALIPDRFDFTEGVTGTNISDGGNDMYDGGNYLGTNVTTAGSFLSYSDNVIVASSNLGTNGQYFTRKHPGLFVFAADIAGLSHFEITGDLGADGSGTTDTTILTTTRGAATYKGYVKRVYNAGDPSVNHLIIVQDDTALTRTASTDTNNDQHRLSGLAAVTRIYYLLYASAGGGYINDTQTKAIMDAFLNTVVVTQWLTLAPPSGSIPTGGNSTLNAVFHPSGLPQGVHTATLRFSSNAPVQPQLDLPVELTITPGVRYFNWSSIPSPQIANVPFAATLTALDASNATVTNFNGSASLQAVGPEFETTTGTGTLTTTFPLSAGSYYELRTQSIYSPAEVGAAGQIHNIALDVTARPSTLTNFTIRLKHTTKTDYSGTADAVWESSGWTTVYQGNLTIPATGWHSLPLATPFDYDGTSHLMVDISFDNASYGTSGSVRYSNAVARMIYSGQYGGSGAPVNWNGSSPFPVLSTNLVNLRFKKRPVFPVNPASIAFTQGVWSGSPSVGHSGTSISLRATHITQPTVTGESGLFDVTSVGSLGLSIAGPGTEGGALNATVTASVAPTSNLTVTLSSSDPNVASPPATVTILAGQTSADCTLNLPEDEQLEGTQTALIRATSPTYNSTQFLLSVNDNDSTTVTLTLPAALAEGTTSTTGQASVQLATQAAADLTISLASSLTSRLTLPTSVVIPAGQSSAAFTLTAPNNSVIDGNQDAVITATLSGSTPATGMVRVFDNESRDLSLVLFTTSISEGGSPATTAGYLSLSGSLTAPLTIQLRSSDPSELNVSGSVTINTGFSSSGFFTITPLNDTDFDGTQTVTITASADTFTDATRVISVLDDDVHHFTLSTVTSPQVRNAPFNVSFTARDINSATITTYAGTPVLSASDGASPLAVTPVTLSGFSNGVRTQSVEVGTDATNAVLTITDPITGRTGTSNAFAVGAGSLDHFGISTLPAKVVTDDPVTVTLTAQDIGNNTVTSFNQTAAVSISGDSTQVTVGTSTLSWSIPLGSQSRSQRMQVIYLPTEVGAARTLHNLALNVATIPGSPFTGYTIRMKHTPATSATAAWDNTGWTTVYQANTTISASGWHQFDFSTPFAYDGVNSLMIDFSYYNASPGVTQGTIRYSNPILSRTTLLQTDTDFGNPLSWTGTTNPTPVTNFVLPNIRFGTVGVSVPVTPPVSGTFVNGVWTGTVSAASVASSVRLRATNGTTSGASNLFDVVSPFLSVTLPETVLESNASVSGTVTISSIQASNTTVSLFSNKESEASPASPTVVIPAGMTSAEFTLNIVNDSIRDGAQPVVISASAAGFVTATASITITDDDVHHFDVSVPPGAKVRDEPFEVTFSARDVNHQVIATYTGSPLLTSTQAGSSLSVAPAQLSGFVNGLKTQAVTVSSFATAAVLTLSDAAVGASGASAPFVVTGPVSSFQWDPIPSPSVSGTPLPVIIRALDSQGNTVGSYGGTAALSLSGNTSEHDYGSGTSATSMPFDSLFDKTRTQQLLRAGDLNLQAGSLTGMAINVTALPASKTFTNFTIRLKTTSRTGYSGMADFIWESNGFTTVFQDTVTLANTGYHTFHFSTPFDYDGTSNLMVDFSYSGVSDTADRPIVKGTTRSGTSTLSYSTSSASFGDPLSWSGTSPAALSDSVTTDIRWTMSISTLPTPSVTSAFIAGVWSGTVSVPQSGLDMRLTASDQALTGTSNAFEVHPVTFALHSEPPFTGGSSNTLSWSLPMAGLLYEIQQSTTPGFESPFSSGFSSDSSATFTSLIHGQPYYYRARMRRLSPLSWTSGWSPVVASTQDAVPPTLNIPQRTTTPASATLAGTASDAMSGIANVTVAGNTATTSNAFATWTSALSELSDGTNSITVTASDKAVPPNTTTTTASVFHIASPSGDPDANGISSLLEHALGLPSGSPAIRSLLPTAFSETDSQSGQAFLSIQFRRRVQRAGLNYLVETSNDLLNWDSTGASVVERSAVPAGDGITELVTVRVTPAIALGGAKFVRLLVTSP